MDKANIRARVLNSMLFIVISHNNVCPCEWQNFNDNDFKTVSAEKMTLAHTVGKGPI